jgi:hypothetical protein
MASELRVNTLKDAAGNNSVGMSYVANGSAKVWANLNAIGTNALRDSFNVGSSTDHGIGDYTINFTNNMNNNDYSVSVNAGDSSKTYPRICACGSSGDTGFATSSHGITCLRHDNNSVDDMEFVNSSVQGDLA